MTKNPFINAVAALAYIVLVALVMSYVGHNAPQEDTVLAPIAAISLFTLSAAIMGYIFILKPLDLYLSGNKKEAIKLFIKTVVIFAAITIAVFSAVVLGFLQ